MTAIRDIFSPERIRSTINQIRSEESMPGSVENLKLLFSLIDLTSLNTQDTEKDIEIMCLRVNEFSNHFPGIENVGAICVYPSLVAAVKQHLTATSVGIASVSAGFPSSQTFLKVKELECKMAVEAGATEIDIVISVGKYLANDLSSMKSEISRIKKAIPQVKLKVILETGLLPGPQDIYRASVTSLEAGADFIKTSTGKVHPAATPEAVLVMCHAIKEYFHKTGKKAGIKPAGGISTANDALEYASIVQSVLGENWLNPGLFRIGASRLANHLLSDIMNNGADKSSGVNYF